MYFIIYKTTNLINGKYYIGRHATENINDKNIKQEAKVEA